MSGKVPYWIELDRDTRTFRLIPERAEVIRFVFEQYLAGRGLRTIAKNIDNMGIKPWGPVRVNARSIGYTGRWSISTVYKILRSEATIGKYTPHIMGRDDTGKRVRIPTEQIDRYFPAVIDESVFYAAAEMFQPNVNMKGRKRDTLNPFSLVARCASCGDLMGRKTSGKRIYLICNTAKVGGDCKHRSINLIKLTDGFFLKLRLSLPYLSYDSPLLDKYKDMLDNLRERMRDTEEQVMFVKTSVLHGHIPTGFMSGDIEKLAKELERFKSLELKLLDGIELVKPRPIQLKVDRLLTLIEKEPYDMPAINALMRGLFERMDVDNETKTAKAYFRHAPEQVISYSWAAI